MRVLILILTFVSASFPQADLRRVEQADQRASIDVMSFNIRYGDAKDGENAWPARREMLFDIVRSENPDLIGLQEALDFQIREMLAALSQYAVVGVGRDDGKTDGEYAAILFRRDRFHVGEAGTFWFSDTPSVVGSTSWGNRITRICTWARFVDRDGSAFFHYNVHLDHQSQPSRVRSTELLARRIQDRSVAAEPVIVTGDFNVGEDNPALRSLVSAPGETPGSFVDTFRVLHPSERQVGTFSGFPLGHIDGTKIDSVREEPGRELQAAAQISLSTNGHRPGAPALTRPRCVTLPPGSDPV